MEDRDVFVVMEKAYFDKWDSHKRVLRGTIEVYLENDLEDEFLCGARYSDKYYFRRRIKELKERYKKVWDRCYLIVSPDIIDEQKAPRTT